MDNMWPLFLLVVVIMAKMMKTVSLKAAAKTVMMAGTGEGTVDGDYDADGKVSMTKHVIMAMLAIIAMMELSLRMRAMLTMDGG